MNKIQHISHKAQQLFNAANSKIYTQKVSTEHPDFTIEDAYAIQLKTVEFMLQSGHSIVGKKIGLTSKAMQKMANIDVPDYGHLYDTMILPEDEAISVSNYNKLLVEPEIAFVLKEDLVGPAVTITDVLQATAGIIPCFEIIDTRYNDININVIDSIADNASSSNLILGSCMMNISDFNLKTIGMILEKNGLIVDFSAGAAVLGHPARAVAWLANTLSKYDTSLKKNEIILSGSFVKALPAEPGDHFTATFDRLGTVNAVFCE